LSSAEVRVVALAGLAGAAAVLAFAPFHWWWLAPVCYAALFLLWRGASPRLAFFSGFSFGGAEFLCGVYWIVISVHQIAEAPMWLAIVLMLGLVVAMALYPALVGWIASRWLGRGRATAWFWLGALPALFVLAEWLRGWLFSGFGWLSPGYAQTESWLIGFAPVLGVLGVSWAVFLLAGAIGYAVSGGRRGRAAGLVAAIAVFAPAWLADRIAWTEPVGSMLSVGLVQGAVPQELKWRPEQLRQTLDLYRGLTEETLGSDLIVWPEAAIPQLYENMGAYLGEIERMAGAAGSRVMLGMLRYHAAGPQNAVFTLGEPDTVYVKRHLVPYGEFFPMPAFLRPWIESLDLAIIDTLPGEPDQPPVDLLDQRIAVTICYEDVFGSEQLPSFPAATLLVNVSNDAWFGDSVAPHQHLQIARMRAAEVRRWQIRSTNTGITAVIDPYGAVAARLPQFEPGVLRASVEGRSGRTPYIVWGNWAVVLLAAGVVAGYWLRTKLTMRPGT
jgi:apolipoprotein N-acyltransferase